MCLGNMIQSHAALLSEHGSGYLYLVDRLLPVVTLLSVYLKILQ